MCRCLCFTGDYNPINCHTVSMNKDRYKGFNFSKASFFLVAFICLILAGAALKLTTPVLLPFVIAVLLAFVLEPLIKLLEKLRMPRIIAIIIAVSGITFLVVSIGYILTSSILTITSLYPKYEKRFTEIYALFADFFDIPYDEHLSLIQNLLDSLGLKRRLQLLALSTGQASIKFLTTVVMVVLFVVFLLMEMAHFKDRLKAAFADRMSERLQKIASSVIVQISRYLSVKFYISLATGIVAGLLLYMLGMDFPVVWGVISFILNFIPNIGSIAAGGGVTLFALVQFWPNPVPIVGAFIIMVSVNFILGNFIEPKVQGDNLGLSPFVILLSLLFWGWLWGFPGLILAVPMTVILKIVCENVPILEPVAIIMGTYSETKNRWVLDRKWQNRQKKEAAPDIEPRAESEINDSE